MTFQLVERTLADAIAENRADGPHWVGKPSSDLSMGCVWVRRALIAVPLFVPILPPNEIYVEDFHAYLPTKYRRLQRPVMVAAIEKHLALLAGARGAAALVVGGSANYYHWLIDFLPKLWLLTLDPTLRSLPLIVNADFTRAQREALEFAAGALGLPIPTIGAGAAVGFAGVFDAHIPTRVPRVAGVGFWRRVIERTAYERPGPPRRRLFVSRAGAARRRLRGEDELASRLARHGFETVEPGALSFTEQVALFADARVIVGVHGAGLTNAVFAPQGATLIELWAEPHTVAYWAIATLRDQRYVKIPLAVEDGSHPNPAHRDVALSAEAEAALVRAVAEAG